MVASPDAGALPPGDRVTGPARTDFSSTRDWEVIEISDSPGGTREVSVQAYDESIFSDTAETQQGVEETTIPTSAQTALSLTGVQFFFNGVLVPDQLNGAANVGEIDFDPRKTGGDYLIGHPDGTEFIIANTSRSLVSQGAQESYTGRVFIIFSKQKVNSERSLAANQDSHILVLRYNTSGAWEYDNNSAWVAFTPDPSDILIFEVDRSGSGWAGKPTRYVGQELLSATEAGRLQYASGATVESLKPGEAGANVTETRTAALIASQGGLATKNSVGTPEIDALAVGTPEVKAGAINEVGSFSNDGVVSTTDGTEIEIGTVTVSVDTDVVEVHGKVNLISSASSVSRMRKDSVTGALLDQTTGAQAVREASMTAEDTSPAATQTYVITLQRQTGTNVGANFRRMTAGNRKK